MSDAPDFEPFMLAGLTYEQATQQMRHTGCAIRRNHWCAPVLIAGKGLRVILDDEGEHSTFRSTAEDRAATDWTMVSHPQEKTDDDATR